MEPRKVQYTKTEEVRKRLHREILSYNCTEKEILLRTGISRGCFDHFFYGTSEGTSYERVIRLLAGKYLPDSILLESGKARSEVLTNWVLFCISPVQQAATAALQRNEAKYFESGYAQRLRRVKLGHCPMLDTVVRMASSKSIALESLIPSFADSATNELTRCILAYGLTEENTKFFFAALRKVFS